MRRSNDQSSEENKGRPAGKHFIENNINKRALNIQGPLCVETVKKINNFWRELLRFNQEGIVTVV